MSGGAGDRSVPAALAATRRLVVVGAINVDFVVAADTLPRPGETVVGPRCERHGGGKGANAAFAAARTGALVTLVGAVGDDETGRVALGELTETGVDVQGVEVRADEPTGLALIVVDAAGENQIAVGAGANAALSPAWVHHVLAEALGDAGCLLVSTEIPNEAVRAAVDCANAAGVTCVLNPAPPIDAVIDALTSGPLLTPNATELATLAAMLDAAGLDCDQRDAPAEVSRAHPARTARAPTTGSAAEASRLAAITKAPVVVTLGGQGALLVTPGRAPQHLPARASRVLDTTGAGDTFNGVLAAAIAAGEELERSAQLAIVAASLSVGGAGARGGMPDSGELDAALAAP
jgi:ribokinase